MRIYMNQYKRPMLAYAADEQEPELKPAHVENGKRLNDRGSWVASKPRQVPAQVWFYGSMHKIVNGKVPDIVDAQPDDEAEIIRIRTAIGKLQDELSHAMERAYTRGTPYKIIKEQQP
jgi:hypothetical protein